MNDVVTDNSVTIDSPSNSDWDDGFTDDSTIDDTVTATQTVNNTILKLEKEIVHELEIRGRGGGAMKEIESTEQHLIRKCSRK